MSSPAETVPPNETPNQKQARLRRERRNAKIQAGGSDRLAKITSLSGRSAPAAEDAPAASVTPKNPVAAQAQQHTSSSLTPTAHDDPEEIDISAHAYTPSRSPRPLTPSQQPPPGTDDPQMRMLQQLLGGAGFDGANPDGSGNPLEGMEGLPPGLAQMFAAMGGNGAGMQSVDAAPASSSAYLWRIVHAAFAMSLAVYIALATNFTGSRVDRTRRATLVDVFRDEVDGAAVGPRLFWLFATVEVVLQSSRYFLERGELRGGGILGTLGGILPEPFGGYVRVLGRYSVIYTTVVADAMVVVFVLGVVAFLRGVVA